jgi:hypothetical protein
VALRNSRVLVPEQGCNRAANDIRTSENDCVEARQVDSSGFEELDDRVGGAGGKEGVACAGRKVSDVVCVEAKV